MQKTASRGSRSSAGKAPAAKGKSRAPFAARSELSSAPRRPPNQAEVAYEQLKAAIVTLAIAPNTPLNEAMICSELGLGRTPVHQACHRLALEGLVQIVPRKGMLVPPLSMDDFLDLVGARRINEPACAALAAERMTDDEIEALATLVADSRRLSRDDLATLIAIDQRFHEAIALGSRNRVFAGFVKNLNDRSARFWALSLSNESHRAETIDEHERIVAALKRRHADRAAQAMRDHIDSFARTFTQLA
ncbi:MAG: GntR family transcriptional regulator [Pseudomonadota bacterium]|jgi:DNA-binding GntR family transcriptional regulator